jgi:hypothetical protein
MILCPILRFPTAAVGAAAGQSPCDAGGGSHALTRAFWRKRRGLPPVAVRPEDGFGLGGDGRRGGACDQDDGAAAAAGRRRWWPGGRV